MKRLESLDVFRGLTIAGMILVNNPGSWDAVYAPLLHADWHGCTPTDLVFPFFLFIVGVAIPLALIKRIERGDQSSAILKKILWRTLLIFGIGLFLSGFPYFKLSGIRIPGVLQRIALVYGACALIYMKTSWRSQAWIGVALLLLYWLLMTVIPVPGFGSPSLAPEYNLGAWLDRLILEGHLWQQSKVWDPEGLLSTLPAIVTGIIGMLTGTWVLEKRGEFEKLTGIFAIGSILVALGLTWDLAFPINKKLWTSSYVVYTAGIAMLSLGVVYWLVDVLGIRRWSVPFKMFGMNALILYAGSSLLAKTFGFINWTLPDGSVQTLGNRIYQNFFQPWWNDYNASLAYAIAFVLVFYLIAYVLYRRKIFIKV